MVEKAILRKLARYKWRHSRRQLLATALSLALAIAQIYFVSFGLVGQSIVDRANIATSMFTVDAILLAAWQWWRQRREVSLEAYFNRLNLPNQRRIEYYEQVVALGDKAGKPALTRALEQFYVFYMYAEIDNLEYALTKYVNGDMSTEFAVRAVKTFVSRCEQSVDFRKMACMLITDSGYPVPFEALVHELLVGCTRAIDDGDLNTHQPLPHPMQYNELDVVRDLRRHT